ncbi:MAG: hypothetical protein KatS3mg087_1557 [Patescibacteria group bacterium]|nr:MAG: hypothetical protein KatS3mg087_1557 [Patescibacteria group bacterium]
MYPITTLILRRNTCNTDFTDKLPEIESADSACYPIREGEVDVDCQHIRRYGFVDDFTNEFNNDFRIQKKSFVNHKKTIEEVLG